MAHLVGSFVALGGEYKSLDSCYEDIREAHGYLAANGADAFRRSADVGGGERWGIGAKRVRVAFPKKPRPAMIGQGLKDHNLAEVVNQCATMERLLDALDWAHTEPSLSGYAVERCHPTTGSSSGDEDDHDLVLVKEDAPDLKAKFEVSDVASGKDGNNKEKKHLASLGVLRKGSLQPADEWPAGRLFLVVSEEFGGWLTRRRLKPPTYRYEHRDLVGSTVIVEVKRRVSA